MLKVCMCTFKELEILEKTTRFKTDIFVFDSSNERNSTYTGKRACIFAYSLSRVHLSTYRKSILFEYFPCEKKLLWEIRAPQYTKQTYMACNSIRYQLYGNYLEKYIRYVVLMDLYSYQHPLAMNAPNYWLRKAI